MTGRRKRMVGRRKRYGRARTLWSTLGVTTLGTVLPGSGIWLTGRHRLGAAILLTALAVVGLLAFGSTQQTLLLSAAVDPDKLLVAGLVSFGLLLGLVTVAVLTYRMVRRPRAPDGERLLEAAFVVVLCLLVATPFALGARYAFVQRDLVKTVFAQGHTVVEDEDAVWGSDGRVNVLLLGGDGGVHRIGIRTDTVILASLDAETGDTTLFSLPRNLQNVPFPEGSELDKLYPDGFSGEGDPLEWMLNAVYGKVPELHPDLFNGSENEGAAALKQAVSAALGIPVDYYVLVNIRGFREVVDAIGGLTVNINHRVPIGGNTDRGIPPKDYLEPGPSQHLDGFEALWFARGRYGYDDYDRMERQRCVMDAFIEKVDPLTLLRQYEELAAAGKELVRTDIPQDLLPEFVELGMELRGGDVRSVVFQPTKRFDPNNPDYEWMRRKVERTLAEEPATSERRPAKPRRSAAGVDSPQPSPSPGADQSPAATSDPCAYHPVG